MRSGLAAEPLQANFNVGDDGGERRVHFMGDRGPGIAAMPV